MTYSYVYHLRNLRPANLLHTQLINFSMRPQHVSMKIKNEMKIRVKFCFLAGLAGFDGVTFEK